MATEDNTPDTSNRVVAFRARDDRPAEAPPPEQSVPDLRQYGDEAESAEDYRHRMTTNVAALAFLGLLVAAGIWMVNVLADMRNAQDCVISGRRNCAQVQVPAQER